MSWLTILTALFCSSTVAHPIHIAISEIEYAEQQRSLQIMHKIFIDDLEDHIQQIEKAAGRSDLLLRLYTPKEHPDADRYISQYVQRYFQIKIDGKDVRANFVGKEYETDAVWIYFEVENIARPKKLELTNRILFDLYDDQANFVYIKIASKKQSLRFRRSEYLQTANF